ncbi:hypothetical protein [Spirilliplanes yamanashiensis]|uniref:hypothetical protein n=1 Tax=Spirilliplanes yamanashiensis TaxID=42233 RepID=UPI0027D91CAC|nr:hypothetical protein [Spirilliplanes yamanashiensis]
MGQKLRARAGRAGAPRWRLPGGRRTAVIAGSALALLVASVVTWLVWPEGSPDPRARVYRDVSACLLTGSGGVNDPAAAPVWAGMQAASLETRGKVQYLEVDGPQTREQAATYLATLVNSRCDLILSVGDAANGAVVAAAPTYTNVRFVLVGTGARRDNVSVVEEQEPAAISRTVEALVAEALKG